MVVPFLKVTKEPKRFELKKGGAIIEVYLSRRDDNFVLSNASFRGLLNLSCVRCGDEFKYVLNEDTAFLIHQGIFEAASNEHLDVVEVIGNDIDLDDLLSSELELIKGDYVYCKDCLSHQ